MSITEWETVFPDEGTRYKSSEDILEALRRWTRDMDFEDKGKSLSKNKRIYNREYSKSGIPN